MTSHTVLAIAIEDRVDVCLSIAGHGLSLSRRIPEDRNYFEAVYDLLGLLIGQLVREAGLPPGKIFGKIRATVVSIPGVVRDRRVSIQLPLWNASGAGDAVRWTQDGRPRTGFDFPDVLGTIAEKIVANARWRGRSRFENTVTVCNDTAAAAAFEYKKRIEAKLSADFVFVKMHAGINAAVVEWQANGDIFLRYHHSEAGHGIAVLHPLDWDAAQLEKAVNADFWWACRFHENCFESMVANHGFRIRAELGTGAVFSKWKKALLALKARGLTGQDLDSALVRRIMRTNIGIALIAHYAGQLVHHLVDARVELTQVARSNLTHSDRLPEGA